VGPKCPGCKVSDTVIVLLKIYIFTALCRALY